MFDIDQLNRVINIQWNRNDIVPVEVAVEDTSGNGVAIQTNKEIEKGGTVTDHDGFFMVFLGKDFL